jgi:hypothetical protein
MGSSSAEEEREGMDPRPTDQELSQWTATVACGEALSQVDTLRLLQEVSRLKAEAQRYQVASLGLLDPAKVSDVVTKLQRERDEAQEIACQLLTIAESRGPKVFGNGGRFPWLKPKK